MNKYFAAILSIALLSLLSSLKAFDAGIAALHKTFASKSKQRGVSFVAGRQVAEDDFTKDAEADGWTAAQLGHCGAKFRN
jgi:hypothetical protein